MKPLLVLITTFVAAHLIIRLKTEKSNYQLAGRISMALMLCFTALGHFMFTEGMTKMIPDFIPFKKEMVYLTGVLEILFGIGIVVPKSKKLAGWLLILFFLMILPANIKAAMENINYLTGELDGNGLTYLWFRVPLQCLFIIWTYFSTIKE